jgi:TRAP-type transport system periplasmic protein
MHSGRRKFLQAASATSAALALPLVMPRFAQAAEYNFKFGTSFPADHPVMVHAANVAKEIEQKSGGRLRIETFPAGQLGSDTDMQSQIRSGALEMMGVSPIVLATTAPAASISGMGFAFRDYGQVWAAMDGDLGNQVRPALEKVGVTPIGNMWDIGFRQVTNSARPVVNAADLKGMKLRVPASPLYISLFGALGAAPEGLSFAETYSALQTHVMDGQENSLGVIDTAKLYETQKYCSLTNHVWDGVWIVVNTAALKRLPPDLRNLLTERFAAAAQSERAATKALNDKLQAQLTGKGMQFNTANLKDFQDALRKTDYYKTWRGKYGAQAWSTLEKYTGPLA